MISGSPGSPVRLMAQICFLGISILLSLLCTIGEGHAATGRSEQIKLQSEIDQFRKISGAVRLDLPMPVVRYYYRTIGPSAMLDVLEENPICHDLAHNVGIVVFEQTGNIEDAMQICNRRCNDACFHGVLMGLFSQANDNHTHVSDEPHAHVVISEFEKEISILCEIPPLSSHHKGDCYHGIGHVSTFAADYEIKEAIRLCKQIKVKMGAYACATGAYMEFIDGKENQREFNIGMCDRFHEFPAACYRHAMLVAFTQKASKEILMSHCLSLNNPIQRRGCFHGLGYGALHPINKNPRLLSELCSFGSTIEESMCLEGGASKVGIYNKTKKIEACAFVSDQKLKKVCMNAHNLAMEADPSGYYVIHDSLFSIIVSFFKSSLNT